MLLACGLLACLSVFMAVACWLLFLVSVCCFVVWCWFVSRAAVCCLVLDIRCLLFVVPRLWLFVLFAGLFVVLLLAVVACGLLWFRLVGFCLFGRVASWSLGRLNGRALGCLFVCCSSFVGSWRLRVCLSGGGWRLLADCCCCCCCC